MSIKDFQVITKLGEGAYSSVYKVKRLSDHQEYALKKVKLSNLSDKEKQNALNEVRILASIRHPNMIAYKEAFIEDASGSLCIVMEYANNGDLYQKIVEHQKKGTLMPENEIWNIFIQMVKGLKALHDYKIFHRDLKSANIFLNKDGTVKLGDLNVSKVAKKGLLYTQTGTPYYASPEVWRDMPYDSKSDVWSLGCVLYEMTTLKPPFRAEDMEGLYKKVLKGYYPRIPTSFSLDLANIIRTLLQVSPHLRPTCDKILQLNSVLKRVEEKHLTEIDENLQSHLLNTIRVPKSLHFLTERLPKPNYTPLKTRKVDKTKFLQTLAGYKEPQNLSMIDDHNRGSDSVDSHLKKGGDYGKIYLPALSKEKADVLKIHNNNRSNILDEIKHSPRQRDPSKEPDITPKREYAPRRARPIQRPTVGPRDLKDQSSVDYELTERENRNPLSVGPSHRESPLKLHIENTRDIEKIRNQNTGRSKKKLLAELIPLPDVQMKRNKPYLLENPLIDIDDASDDLTKRLPPLIPTDKYGKLPPLRSENTPHIRYNRLKELSKVYKVHLGNIEEIGAGYGIVTKPIQRKDKSRAESQIRNANTEIHQLSYDSPQKNY